MREVHRTQQGFTLIEVLVALTLMALVSLISWRGLDAVQRTGERLDERAEDTLSMVRALGQIERDLLLHASSDVLSDPLSAATGAATGSAGRAGRMPPGIAWDRDAGLSLVRAAGDGLWQQLRWYLKNGNLIRAVGAPSYLLPLPAADTEVVVLEHIRGLSVKMWQPERGWVEPPSASRESVVGQAQAGSSAPPEADTAAKAQATGPAASGLEISLYREGPAQDKPYRKVVVLP